MWLRIIKYFYTHQELIFVLLLAAVLRFWQIPQLMIFTLDEELEAFIVKNIVTGFHFPLIGVSVAPVGIYLSPIFYYLAAIPFAIGQLNPLAWGYSAAVLGVMTTLVLYYTTEHMFSRKIAVIASILYASSYLMVMYDKHFWNVTPIPIVAILVIYSLFQIISKKFVWSIILALSLVVGLSAHLSSMSLVLLVFFVWLSDRITLKNKYVLTSIAILLIAQLPLLLFEIRHSFTQSKALLAFFSGPHVGFNLSRIVDNLMLLPKVYSRLIYTFGSHDFAAQHTYGFLQISYRDQQIPLVMLLIGTILLILFFNLLLIRFKDQQVKLHASLILVTIISLIGYGLLFKGGIFEFYLALLFPSLFVITAVLIDWVWTKTSFGQGVMLGLLVITVGANILAVFDSTNSYGLANKLQIIAWVKDQLGGQPYQLHSIGQDHKYEGYRYLFEQFYQAPQKSYVDAQLAWTYQSNPVQSPPSTMVILTSNEPDFQKQLSAERNLYLPYAVEEKQFGNINVLIVSLPTGNLQPLSDKGQNILVISPAPIIKINSN